MTSTILHAVAIRARSVVFDTIRGASHRDSNPCYSFSEEQCKLASSTSCYPLVPTSASDRVWAPAIRDVQLKVPPPLFNIRI